MNLQEIPGWAVAISPSERNLVAYSLGFETETEFSEMQNDFIQMYGNVQRFHTEIEKAKDRIELKEQRRERDLLVLKQRINSCEQKMVEIKDRSKALDQREKELLLRERGLAIRQRELLEKEEALRMVNQPCAWLSCSNFSVGNATTMIYFPCGHALCQNCVLSRKECVKCKNEKTQN